MKLAWNSEVFCCLVVACLSRFIVVKCLPVGKNITLTKLFSVQMQDLADISEGLPRSFEQLGIDAQPGKATLGNNVTEFRLHRPGFEHVPRSVSLESNAHPGLFLRYKNYKFRLEKAKPTGLFEKDSTFLERHSVGAGTMSLELFTHPGWFVCHETESPFTLKAASKVVGSEEFDQKCVFRPKIRVPHALLTAKNSITPVPGGNGKQEAIKVAEIQAAEAAKILDNLVAKENAKAMPSALMAAATGQKLGAISGQNLGAQTSIATVRQNLGAQTSIATVRQNLGAQNNAAAVGKYLGAQKALAAARQYAHVQNKVAPARQKLLAQINNVVVQKPGVQSLTNQLAQNKAGGAKAPLKSPSIVPAPLAPQVKTQLGFAWPGAKKPFIPVNKLNKMSLYNKEAYVASQTAYIQPKGGQQYLQGGQRYQQRMRNGQMYNRQKALMPYKNAAGNWARPMPQTRFTANAKLGATRYQQQRYQGLNRAPLAPKVPPPLKPMNKQPVRVSGTGNLQSPKPMPYSRPGTAMPSYNGQMSVAIPPAKANAGVNALSRRPAVTKQQSLVQTPNPGLKPTLNALSGNYAGSAASGYANRVNKIGSAATYPSGVGSGVALSYHHPKEPRPIDPKTATYGKLDKCISIKFFNKLRKPVKIVSSMKMAGYLVTAETFKLKTIFKHARRNRKVIFYAQDLDDQEDVLLNNNNVVTVVPGPCDLPYRNIFLARHNQFSNQAIENYLKGVDKTSNAFNPNMQARPNPQSGFGQWMAFGPCSTSCGKGAQTRTRACIPGRACMGPTMETRACIQPPCKKRNCLETYGGNAASPGKCCSLPFIYKDTVYDKCITHSQTGNLWCATTPNFDEDKSWGFCQKTERRSNTFYRPPGYIPVPVSRVHIPRLPDGCNPSCYDMCIPGCHVTCCSAHALAFPSI